MHLSKAQRFAIEHIEAWAKQHKHEARLTINHILEMSNISTDTFEKAVDAIKTNARISLHFHPDRLDSSLNSIAESLFMQGEYKSQFETLISSGSVSAVPGGERDLWEKRMFGGAYHIGGAAISERPKYGALNLMLPSDGPAPRFGSCYFLLYPAVSHRSSFTYLDSHLEIKEKGTYKEFDLILAALLEDSFSREFALGESDLQPPRLVNHLLTTLSKPQKFLIEEKVHRNLDQYIEAQIHGSLSLKDDVEILVADSSFKGTDIGEIMEQLCSKFSIKLYWRRGFNLKVQDVPSDFRGAKMPVLAHRIAERKYINARIIGSAMKEMYLHPDQWSDYGTMKEIVQDFKLLWHVLVRYGSY
ncbi:DUF3626 domain-containing protein [Pradoshia eiseniae]|uniref:DUF3626 domain-containing protein n=1 Tax=Pradoshia eiseniae TaxID=2064768 RepID=A0A2S7N0Z0_9BACI|nr:DUF3626 domain-containing protein [Pradoshia eiseniae]PQD95667.1 DUF3626 domain-containing protein [Pradoshia eiseniae]